MIGWICLLALIWSLYLLLFLPLFIYKESKIGAVKAVGYKLVLSISFCMVGLIGALRHPADLFTILVFLGLVFSVAGDYYLVHIKGNSNKYIRGIRSFSAALFLYVLAISLYSGVHPLEALIMLVLLIPMLVFCFVRKAEMGKARRPLLLYLGIASYMAVKAVMLTHYVGHVFQLQEMFCTGAFLFYISDIILGAWRYLELKQGYAYLNYIVYFTAQLLIATAIVF